MMTPFFPVVNPSIVILIGAGASMGCGGLNENPPGGAGLYAKLAEFSEKWNDLPIDYIKRFNEKGFEEAFNDWEDPELERFKSTLLWELAFFFDEYKIVNFEENAYSKLVEIILRENLLPNILVASLNYDSLVEQAFIHHEVNIRCWGPPWPNVTRQISLVKPNGSSNFLPDPNNFPIIFGKGYTGDGAINGKYLWVWPGDVVNKAFPLEQRLYGIAHPIMAHYNRKKLVRCGRDLLDALRAEYSMAINTAKIILVIGAKYNDYDDFMWEPIKKTKGTVFFLNRNPNACADFKTFRPNSTTIEKEFSDAIEDIKEILLKA